VRKRDTLDVVMAAVAVVADAVAVSAGFLAAAWIRFEMGWFRLPYGRPPDLYPMYGIASLVVGLLFVLVFRSLGLYRRPQVGSFADKIPRIIRGVLTGVVLSAVLAFAVKNEVADFSRLTIALSGVTSGIAVLIERYILYRVEWNLARHSRSANSVLIVGTGEVAARLYRALKREPMLRARVVGFLSAGDEAPDPAIPPEMIRGTVAEIEKFLEGGGVDQIILAASDLGRIRILDIVRMCVKNLVLFNMVPDLFSVMTSSMDVQTMDDIPLLGLAPWPLDLFWNRALKRLEDVVGAVIGLVLAAPIIAVAAVLIRRESPGPVFYRQKRCGEGGREFILYKLRTMRANAEADTGPVFASPDDPRRTRIGAFLRRTNLDELPQLWNVLKGEMSLVGPRPERPEFVERFREEIARYMWRHVSKPGMTGWAQVNGLRGNTSIEERIKYDLYYLENWSLAFDFKILLKTLFARENAY